MFREQNLNWEIEEIGGDMALVGDKAVGGDAGELEVEEDKGGWSHGWRGNGGLGGWRGGWRGHGWHPYCCY